MPFRFIHAADVHLDSPLLALDEYPGSPYEEVRRATRGALTNLVDLAIREQAAFVVIAGDLFDGEWRDCNTGLFFVSQMNRLRDADIHAYIALGNHDAANRFSHSLPWGPNVHMFDHRKPQRLQAADDVWITGQSFRSQQVTEDVSYHFPPGRSDAFNIGVLHTSLTGAEGHEPYAPCTVPGLHSHQYQYWALGHIHTRRIVSEEPWIVFPGNIQGRSVRETGPRGCYIVNVGDNGKATLEFEPLDCVRWAVVPVDLDSDRAAADWDSIVESALSTVVGEADGRAVAARLECRGCGPCFNWVTSNLTEARARARSLAGPSMHIESVVTRRVDAVESADFGLVKELREFARGLASDPDAIAELKIALRDLRDKLATEVRLGEECPDVHDDALLREAICSADACLNTAALAKGAGR